MRYLLEIIIYDHKCSFLVCFKIFDADNDGVLNEDEVSLMIESMLEVAGQTKTGEKEGVSPRLSNKLGDQTDQGRRQSYNQLDQTDSAKKPRFRCAESSFECFQKPWYHVNSG